MQRLLLSQIHTSGGTQTRAILDDLTVADYAAAMEEGDDFPPVTVYADGETHWLADGFHRVAAARKVGFTDIDADVRQGTRRDAILHSVGANAVHGLRRTNDDKRRAVETLLRDREWAQWSDREIARRTGTSHPFVMKIREQVVTVTTSTRKGGDGKTYPAPAEKTAHPPTPTPEAHHDQPAPPAPAERAIQLPVAASSDAPGPDDARAAGGLGGGASGGAGGGHDEELPLPGPGGPANALVADRVPAGAPGIPEQPSSGLPDYIEVVPAAAPPETPIARARLYFRQAFAALEMCPAEQQRDVIGMVRSIMDGIEADLRDTWRSAAAAVRGLEGGL